MDEMHIKADSPRRELACGSFVRDTFIPYRYFVLEGECIASVALGGRYTVAAVTEAGLVYWFGPIGEGECVLRSVTCAYFHIFFLSRHSP
jgi:hypothetical protein